ncbi:MAG: MBL fold metallo-hydrolase [Steroidobacteraceae bacterium]
MNPARGLNGTQIDEIADGLFRVHTPVASMPGGFSFNQYLLRDERSLLFHTGPRALFPQIRDAIATVVPLEKLHYIGFSHVESDECGSLNQFLAAAPVASPLCGRLASLVSMSDLADRAPVALADQQSISLGRYSVTWIDAPHVPHGWENGYLMIDGIRALLCGDLLTQPGADHPPVVESDILAPSEAMRAQMDYYAHGPNTVPVIQRLAKLRPGILACMHGSAWRGDGERLLTDLARKLA